MRRIFIFLSLFNIYYINLNACTNILVSKGASTDGSVMISYAADAHFMYGELYYYPAKEYEKGAMLDIYEWDTGHYLGKIKQAKETYSVVGNINEYQVSMGETTFTGREELQDTTGILDYGSLMYIALQRSKTAREAIYTIDKLVSEYGYCSTGESFSIADPEEVWIMEIIGKGKRNTGAVWVARKVPDGYICAHANQARITSFPLNDPENCLYSKDVISLAREKGWFEGEDSEFSFADTYAPLDFGGARFCEARVWSVFNRVTKGMDKYVDYALGENLENKMPLFVKPDKFLSNHDVMELMRDYYQGTELDMTKDVGAGPYSCIVRWRPLTWEVDSVTYFNERAISTQQTGFSFVAQSRSWLPPKIGGIIWFGVDDTYSTVYTPMYCGINKIPYAFATGDGAIMEFNPGKAFWVFNQVSNFAYTRYNLMIPDIKERQVKLEENYTQMIPTADSIALSYADDEIKMVHFLTNFSREQTENTMQEWKSLYAHLFTKFMDGNVKFKVEGEMVPEIKQPGYSKEYYRMIIDKTGDKFKYHGEGH